MHVNEITIQGRRFDPDQDTHSACVGFELEDGGSSSFFCTIQAAAETAAAQIDVILVREARRQALRMPEIRSGRDSLFFHAADNAFV
ncbi:MAG: hypothetical protein ACC631_08370 [Halocynthiibacter sp.]